MLASSAHNKREDHVEGRRDTEDHRASGLPPIARNVGPEQRFTLDQADHSDHGDRHVSGCRYSPPQSSPKSAMNPRGRPYTGMPLVIMSVIPETIEEVGVLRSARGRATERSIARLEGRPRPRCQGC